MITTWWSVAAVVVLAVCLVCYLEGELTTRRSRDRAALAVTAALAVLVLADGWLAATGIAVHLLMTVTIGRAVVGYAQRRWEGNDRSDR